MEITNVILLVGCLSAVCSGLPAGLESKKDEVESVPPVRTYGDQPIVDTGVIGGGYNPFSNPFGGLFTNLEGMMDRMRQQIASLLNRFPLRNAGNSSSEDLPSFPDLFQHPAIPGLSDIDLSKGNTTSITKVINGHKVVINETEYKNEDDFGGTFFKVRIIDVKSDSSELTTERDAEAVPEEQPPKDREEIGNSIENEITKSKEAESIKANLDQYRNIETFDEVTSLEDDDKSPTMSQFSSNGEWFHNTDPEWSYVTPIKTVDSNAIETNYNDKELERELPIDLSRDTYVNELLAKNGAPVNPDAEVFLVGNVGKPFKKAI